MKRLTATAIAIVLLQASPTFAGGFGKDVAKTSPTVQVIKSTDSDRTGSPSLSSSQIAAIQYHDEPLGVRCQTRAGVFAISPERPVDTACAVNGLPGFVLP